MLDLRRSGEQRRARNQGFGYSGTVGARLRRQSAVHAHGPAQKHPRPWAEVKAAALRPVKWLLDRGTVVICAGRGGIPTMYEPGADRKLGGVEAVIDKDLCSELLARELGADCSLCSRTPKRLARRQRNEGSSRGSSRARTDGKPAADGRGHDRCRVRDGIRDSRTAVRRGHRSGHNPVLGRLCVRLHGDLALPRRRFCVANREAISRGSARGDIFCLFVIATSKVTLLALSAAIVFLTVPLD